MQRVGTKSSNAPANGVEKSIYDGQTLLRPFSEQVNPNITIYLVSKPVKESLIWSRIESIMKHFHSNIVFYSMKH